MHPRRLQIPLEVKCSDLRCDQTSFQAQIVFAHKRRFALLLKSWAPNASRACLYVL